MPRTSLRREYLELLDGAALAVVQVMYENALLTDTESDDSQSDSWTDLSGSLSLMLISPPSPLSPIFRSEMSFDTQSSTRDADLLANKLLEVIQNLRDEVVTTRVLEMPSEPMPRAPQLHVLPIYARSRPKKFRQKLRVDPQIFNDILDCITDHPVFHNQSNNKQLPVDQQLAIFLNRIGHYGNGVTPDDIALWGGVSVGTVFNCMHRVMVAILSLHDEFIYIPLAQSDQMRRAQTYAEARTCSAWRNGVFAADGTAIPLFAKPGLFGETFFDRKSNYSLNCQVCTISIYMMEVLTLVSL